MPRISKKFALLLVLAMLASMFVGMGTVGAAAGIQAINVPVVDVAVNQELGAIKVTVPGGALTDGDAVTFTLPEKYTFLGDTFNGYAIGANGNPNAVKATDNNEMYVPATINASGDANGLLAADIDVAVTSDREIKITATNGSSQDFDFIFYIYLRDIDVASGADKECVATFDGSADSGFPIGTVTVATTSTTGSVTVSVVDQVTSTEDFTATVKVKEDRLGSLEDTVKTLKLRLPAGYEYNGVPALADCVNLWGNPIKANLVFTLSATNNELQIEYTGAATTEASAFSFPIDFSLIDEDKAGGDIMATVSGETTASPSSVNVGTLGSKTITCEVSEVVKVQTGMVWEELGDIIFKAPIERTVHEGDTITMTLPSYAKFVYAPADEDEGSDLRFKSTAGTDGQELKYTFDDGNAANEYINGDDAEFTLKGIRIALDITAPGDLKMTLGGTAGATGEVIVATVEKLVDVKADSSSDVKIGVGAQKLGDFTITETNAGAIQAKTQLSGEATQSTLMLKVPNGSEFAKLPKVEVTSGDLELDIQAMNRTKPASTDLYQFVNIPVLNDSTVASTIKVTEVYVTVDRTVPEGDLKVAILGSAVLESNTAYTDAAKEVDLQVDDARPVAKLTAVAADGEYAVPNGLFPGTAAAAAAVVAKVATPAPSETKGVSVFTIGAAKYTLNGAEVAIDVAPYIKDGRTYLPIAYVANALGIASTNVFWDAANQTVTLMKGDKVVQLKIGSSVMLVNGAAITLDVAPEISGSRTCLPVALIAQAFGYTATWDAATQTVTLK